MLPSLEKLAIHSKLHRMQSGFFSAIPTITKLFSSKHPSLLKHLTLDFNCVIYTGSPIEFPPSLSAADVICIPLVQLLSSIFAFSSDCSSSSPFIQVDLFLDGNPFKIGKSFAPPHCLLEELLKKFTKQAP